MRTEPDAALRALANGSDAFGLALDVDRFQVFAKEGGLRHEA